MSAITISRLLTLCLNEVKKGNGEKKILISNDDEGNGYHELFYSFSDAEEIFNGEYAPMLPYGVKNDELNNYKVLG